MKKFTAPIDIVANDKASKNVNKINQAFTKMTNNVVKDSAIAGNSFTRFTQNVSLRSKQALVSANNLNASINRVFRNISKKLGGFGLFVGFSSLIIGIRGVINKFADFEQANANLASVMINATQPELKELQKDAQRLGAITAKSATEVVGLQEAYARLGFAQRDIINMTESTISGSVAMRGELDATAELVGAMVKSFDNFESVNAPQIIDQLTASTQKSALNFEKLQTALPIVAGAANAANVPFTKLLSSLGKTADAGIDASSSATALRNIYLEAAKQGVSYEKLLQKVANSTDMLKTANDLFGKRAAVVAVTLAKNIDLVNELDNSLQNAGGTAQKAADIQLNTLKGTITILKSAWEGWILSLDDGNGKLSTFLKTSVKVVTEVLSIATGTAKAETELNKAEQRIRKIANTVRGFLKVLKMLTIALITFKTVMFAAKLITGAYNIVLGITGALSKTAAIGIGKNTIALGAYAIATKIATAAAWLFNSALWANPITWIIAGIAALVAGIIALIVKWKEITNWVKHSESGFAKFIRAAIYPAVIGFKAMKWAIEGIVNAFKQMVNWVKTSDSGFAKFLRGALNGVRMAFEGIKTAIQWIIDKAKQAIEPVRKLIGLFSRATQEELGVVPEAKSLATGINSIESKEDKLISALDINSRELEKNTDAQFGGWKGRFTTTILRDANITENAARVVQRDLATQVFTNENNITNNQREVLGNVQTSTPRRQSTQNSQTTIYIVDKTGDRFGIEVEGTGVNVITTGNE